MALTILVTPAAGDTIQASVWINEFNNIYNNPISLISPFTATVDLNGQTLSGTATFSGAITFSSTITVSGAATFNGNVTLGNATADTITITGILASGVEFGHASDTTLTRSAAGKLAVEGIDAVLLSGAQTLTDKTLTAPVLGGTVTGTYTLGGTPTITAPTFTTSITGPLDIGGTAVDSTLILRSTSGVGTSDAIIFQTGNNGAIEAGRINTTGIFLIGGATAVTGALLGDIVLKHDSYIRGTISTNANTLIGMADAGGVNVAAIGASDAAYVRIASKTTTGDLSTSAPEGTFVLNTFDNNLKILEGSTWRSILTW